MASESTAGCLEVIILSPDQDLHVQMPRRTWQVIERSEVGQEWQ